MMHERMFRDGERFWGRSRRESSFQKGDLKYVLLHLIKDKPRHGYEIIRELEEQSYGFYKPSPGVIYPTLQMLEEMGYAKSNEEEGKKVYTITDAGREFLAQKKVLGEDIKNHVKHHWEFKNLGHMAMIIREYRELERLLGHSVRRLDEEKTERIMRVLSQTYHDIQLIIER
jgi:DNA-binding PadR family transcriptional regulator